MDHLVKIAANERVNTALQQCVLLFEQTFPHAIRGYYIEGSYADESNVNTSDLDLLVVAKSALDEQTLHACEKQLKHYATHIAVELDIEVAYEQVLQRGATPTFKLGSQLIYGEDIRPIVPLLPLAAWTRDRMHSSYWRTINLFQRPLPIRYPLSYPDAKSEFYGYDARKLRLADRREVPCTRDLIRLTGWSATALLAYKAGIYVARKRDCHTLYRAYFHDEWADLLQDIYEQCRGKWNYLLPEDVIERTMLRAICERTLGFENHFLLLYKEFVLSELRSNHPAAVLQVLQVLKTMVYQDDGIEHAIQILADSEMPEIRVASKMTLQAYLL